MYVGLISTNNWPSNETSRHGLKKNDFKVKLDAIHPRVVDGQDYLEMEITDPGKRRGPQAGAVSRSRG